MVLNSDKKIACLACRKHKMLCTMDMPSCLGCVRRKNICQYPSPPDRKLAAQQRVARQRMAQQLAQEAHGETSFHSPTEPPALKTINSHAVSSISEIDTGPPSPPTEPPAFETINSDAVISISEIDTGPPSPLQTPSPTQSILHKIAELVEMIQLSKDKLRGTINADLVRCNGSVLVKVLQSLDGPDDDLSTLIDSVIQDQSYSIVGQSTSNSNILVPFNFLPGPAHLSPRIAARHSTNSTPFNTAECVGRQHFDNRTLFP